MQIFLAPSIHILYAQLAGGGGGGGGGGGDDGGGGGGGGEGRGRPLFTGTNHALHDNKLCRVVHTECTHRRSRQCPFMSVHKTGFPGR